jgi:hypothetical protein
MTLKEIPPLPFAPNLDSATEWLDELPISNIRECCRLLYPALQALKEHPLEARLRLDILEKCRPAVAGATRDLLPYFLDKPFPLDGRNLKIASLCSRFHLELAAGYRQIAEDRSFPDTFDPAERALVVGRALEHLAHSLLRAAQIYVEPSSSVLPSVYALYRLAERGGLLDAAVAADAATVRELFLRIVWFRLAAPNRLDQRSMQRLFDLLADHSGASGVGASSAAQGMRAVFCFDPTDRNALMPMVPSLPPEPEMRFLFPEGLLSQLRKATRATGRPEHDPLIRVLPRLGDRLPCQDKTSGRRAALLAGLDAITGDLTRIQARRFRGGDTDPWPNANQLQLAPSGEPIGSAALYGSKTDGFLTPALIKTPSSSQDRRFARFANERPIEVHVSELPGFYLIDAGAQVFRVGDLMGLNTDDEVIQVGVVRGGQIRDARFWYSFELLGNTPRLVRVQGDKAEAGMLPALLFESPGADEPGHLILKPVKWRGGEAVTVHWPDGTRAYRVARLLEMGANFCHFAVSA